MPETSDAPPSPDPAIDAAPLLAGLTITPRQRAGVAMHLATSLAVAERIGPVGNEAAPTFRP
ncbi:DUF4089 domain-containing protein [Acuticoccus sp. I52.16.1]|uniref:DUF4089 domain-containing protein n=1 Tax=Acuticoccus sp. I52.16.1 TaxID=2928472 RepID=UPI001FD100DA|nr:DUF4089 domain-containing protein [Acuticoccus sp. I52.16.1]UOM32658.1 DUF4089 domain-containing protein [Acuticoccus sp. I52.16.1]